MLPSVSARTASGPTFLPLIIMSVKSFIFASFTPSTTSKTLMSPAPEPVSTT